MLDAKDIQLLGEMFEKQDKKFDQKLERLEQRIDQKIDAKMDGLRDKMNRGFEKVRDDIIDVIDQNIQPQLTNLNRRVTRLERRLA